MKVWLSFAQFELQLEHDDAMAQARHVYREANNALRRSQDKEERLMLLETWRDFEQENGGEEEKREVGGLMPRRIKRRRKIQTEDGSDGGLFGHLHASDSEAEEVGSETEGQESTREGAGGVVSPWAARRPPLTRACHHHGPGKAGRLWPP